MKRTILLSFLCFAFFAANAQITVTPEESDGIFENQDISDNFLDLVVKFSVSNTTDEMIAIKWLREVEGDCDGFETAICDNNTCYFTTVSSNINANLNEPMFLEPQETFDEFALHIYPRTNAGCCEVKIHFSLVDDPDNILATSSIFSRVNADEDCNEIVSTADAAEIASLNLYPNPTNDFFMLTTTDLVSTVLLRNTLGQELKSYNYDIDGQYDVSNMSSGFYFIQMLDEQGATLKLLPLTINAN